MEEFKRSLKLSSGDKVAIISPSSGCANLFPWIYNLGIKRLEEEFNLTAIEFPTACQTPDYLAANPQARAIDINNAFADPQIKAIIATTGGSDQIEILPYLDADVIQRNPKMFLGYSDNTNLHLYLFSLGIVSYYGCSVMSQLAMQGGIHAYTRKYIQRVLFEDTIGQLDDCPEWTDYDLDWSVEENLQKVRPMEKSPKRIWQNCHHKVIKGRLFGGCLETLKLHLSVNVYIPNLEVFTEIILYVETSEELPSADLVYSFFATLGERHILKKIKALIVAIPKTQFIGQTAPEGRETYMINQQIAINRALDIYNSELPVVFNLHFGHVDPQAIIPNGGFAIINGIEQKIFLE